MARRKLPSYVATGRGLRHPGLASQPARYANYVKLCKVRHIVHSCIDSGAKTTNSVSVDILSLTQKVSISRVGRASGQWTLVGGALDNEKKLPGFGTSRPAMTGFQELEMDL